MDVFISVIYLANHTETTIGLYCYIMISRA